MLYWYSLGVGIALGSGAISLPAWAPFKTVPKQSSAALILYLSPQHTALLSAINCASVCPYQSAFRLDSPGTLMFSLPLFLSLSVLFVRYTSESCHIKV